MLCEAAVEFLAVPAVAPSRWNNPNSQQLLKSCVRISAAYLCELMVSERMVNQNILVALMAHHATNLLLCYLKYLLGRPSKTMLHLYNKTAKDGLYNWTPRHRTTQLT